MFIYTVLMLLLLSVAVLIFPIVWRCTYDFYTITIDSDLLFYVFSMLLYNNGMFLPIIIE